jgi:D-glycero-alpha-D-manno-heptose-7-phosphate kinase
MLLLYTGQTRSTSEVLTEQNVNLESEEKFRILEKMVNFVEPGYELLRAADWRAFGSLLNESWQYKKQMASSVSNSEIDRAYDSALDAGAWGGKLLGAGGGGFLLFFCDPDKFEKVKAAVGMRQMPFKIELDGSKIIYLDEESLGNRA